ncbi:MAG: hypothetical protein KME64_30120 [Scytonematopsis contorta HA4267-MV1]|jgi:hypothetical protein|nr:hypothetical protein [Scytonematopsis contorta HA4267-MV1]
MHKNIGFRSLILLGVTSILASTAVFTSAQTTPARKNPQASSWPAILQRIRRRQQPISRPLKGAVCFISPQHNNPESSKPQPKPIYSSRPLFLWNGNISKIALSNPGSDNYFWENKKTQQKNFVTYEGQDELKPGNSYEWIGFRGKTPIILSQFKIMDAQQRQLITNELKALETRLRAEGANKETIALNRADYFIGKELWSDVFQEIYSIPNPSPELLGELQKLPKEICEDKRTG